MFLFRELCTILACVDINKYLACHKLRAALVDYKIPWKRWLCSSSSNNCLSRINYRMLWSAAHENILIFTLRSSPDLTSERRSSRIFPLKNYCCIIFSLYAHTIFCVGNFYRLSPPRQMIHFALFRLLVVGLEMRKLTIYAYITKVYVVFVLQFYALLTHITRLRAFLPRSFSLHF